MKIPSLMLLKATSTMPRKNIFDVYGKNRYLIRRALYILFCIISGCAHGERGYLDTNQRLPDNGTTAVYWF
jgi:hypothetical protein